MNTQISILACELRKYSREQLVQKLATLAVHVVRLSQSSDSLDDAENRADAALHASGILEDLA